MKRRPIEIGATVRAAFVAFDTTGDVELELGGARVSLRRLLRLLPGRVERLRGPGFDELHPTTWSVEVADLDVHDQERLEILRRAVLEGNPLPR